eukprot:EG_transcript_12183
MAWGAAANHNVRVTYLFNFLSGVSDGVCNSTVAPALIFLLTASNARVGFVEALQGGAEGVVAILLGVALDRTGMWRQTALRWGGAVGVASAALTVVAVYYEHFGAICAAFLITGVWNAFGQVPVDAIMADSLATGTRSKAYSISYILTVTSKSTGPLFALCMFYFFGNRWAVDECRFVMYVGCGITVVASLVQCLFLESETLGHESEAIQVESPAGDVNGDVARAKFQAGTFLCIDAAWVPWVIGVSNILSGLAAGMTIKFFPLFFKNEVHLSPVAVNLIFFANPLCLAAMSTVVLWVSRYIGRVEALLLARTLGIALLFLMALTRPYWHRLGFIVPVYILRTALINSPKALNKSIMMDFVPKSARGQWSAVSSIASFGWSGSAVLGGIMVDAEGYGFSFHITAIAQAVSTSIWLLLLPIIPHEPRPLTPLEHTAVPDTVHGPEDEPVEDKGSSRNSS